MKKKAKKVLNVNERKQLDEIMPKPPKKIIKKGK